MIVPNVRQSFGRSEAAFLVWLVSRGVDSDRDRLDDRLREEGLDSILDDPRTFNAVMAGPEFSSASSELVFYVLVRHALLEEGIADRQLADYIASLLLTFGRSGRAFRVADGEQEFHHLVDIVSAVNESDGRRAFLLRAHLGEFALWLSGLFPDHITARVQRRGAPGIRYFEELGSAGYRMASQYRDAEKHGLDRVYGVCAEAFRSVRMSLNRIADRHMFPARGDRIERLLRQVSDEFDRNTGTLPA